jgi:methyl-accepting chemotaxis protein
MTAATIPPVVTADSDEVALLRAAIAKASAACRAAAEGDLEVRITHIEQFGELRPFLSSINHLLDMTDAFVREASASLEHAAQGKFYRRFIERGMRGAFGRGARVINEAREAMERFKKQAQEQRIAMADALEQQISGVVGDVSRSAGALEKTAETMLKDAGATHQQSQVVAKAADVAAENAHTVATAAEELSASISEISRQVGQSTAAADGVVDQVRQASEAMARLNEAAGKIDRVIGFIQGVAGQTNLLALNATIEAARAGEAGKGFAVVASEVKQLARQSADAAKQIADEVRGMQAQAKATTEAVAAIARRVDTVKEISTTISAAVEEQNAATSEISSSVARTAGATGDVSSNIKAISATAERGSESAEGLKQASSSLSRLADKLADGVRQFLIELRAGR